MQYISVTAQLFLRKLRDSIENKKIFILAIIFKKKSQMKFLYLNYLSKTAILVLLFLWFFSKEKD